MSVAFLHGIDDIMAQLIVNKGYGTDPTWWETHGINDVTDTTHDWPVNAGGEPPQPDEVITVYETTPISFGKSQIDGEQLQHYGFTVRIRGRTKASARNKAETIRIGFNESVYRDTVTLDGKSYVVFSVSKTSLVPFGMVPDSKRWLVNVNCTAVILPQPFTT